MQNKDIPSFNDMLKNEYIEENNMFLVLKEKNVQNEYVVTDKQLKENKTTLLGRKCHTDKIEDNHTHYQSSTINKQYKDNKAYLRRSIFEKAIMQAQTEVLLRLIPHVELNNMCFFSERYAYNSIGQSFYHCETKYPANKIYEIFSENKNYRDIESICLKIHQNNKDILQNHGILNQVVSDPNCTIEFLSFFINKMKLKPDSTTLENLIRAHHNHPEFLKQAISLFKDKIEEINLSQILKIPYISLPVIQDIYQCAKKINTDNAHISDILPFQETSDALILFLIEKKIPYHTENKISLHHLNNLKDETIQKILEHFYTNNQEPTIDYSSCTIELFTRFMNIAKQLKNDTLIENIRQAFDTIHSDTKKYNTHCAVYSISDQESSNTKEEDAYYIDKKNESITFYNHLNKNKEALLLKLQKDMSWKQFITQYNNISYTGDKKNLDLITAYTNHTPWDKYRTDFENFFKNTQESPDSYNKINQLIEKNNHKKRHIIEEENKRIQKEKINTLQKKLNELTNRITSNYNILNKIHSKLEKITEPELSNYIDKDKFNEFYKSPFNLKPPVINLEEIERKNIPTSSQEEEEINSLETKINEMEKSIELQNSRINQYNGILEKRKIVCKNWQTLLQVICKNPEILDFIRNENIITITKKESCVVDKEKKIYIKTNDKNTNDPCSHDTPFKPAKSGFYHIKIAVQNRASCAEHSGLYFINTKRESIQIIEDAKNDYIQNAFIPDYRLELNLPSLKPLIKNTISDDHNTINTFFKTLHYDNPVLSFFKRASHAQKQAQLNTMLENITSNKLNKEQHIAEYLILAMQKRTGLNRHDEKTSTGKAFFKKLSQNQDAIKALQAIYPSIFKNLTFQADQLTANYTQLAQNLKTFTKSLGTAINTDLKKLYGINNSQKQPPELTINSRFK